MSVQKKRTAAAYAEDLEAHVSPAFVQDDRNGNINAYLFGEVTADWREQIVVPLHEKMHGLSLLAEPVATLHVSSNGGNSFVMWDLVEWMEHAKRRGVTVRTIVTSHAFSAGSIIAVAGSKGERYIGKRATHVVHYGYVYGQTVSTPLQADRENIWTKRHFAAILAHYKRHCKIPDLAKAISDDSLNFDAAECLRHGLADKYTSAL